MITFIITTNKSWFLGRGSWSMDPKQKPKTKKQTTPTPQKRKKGS